VLIKILILCLLHYHTKSRRPQVTETTDTKHVSNKNSQVKKKQNYWKEELLPHKAHVHMTHMSTCEWTNYY